jgi:hypothetical protein
MDGLKESIQKLPTAAKVAMIIGGGVLAGIGIYGMVSKDKE